MDNSDGALRLHETWQRLEAICQRLWDCDSPAAVELQALIEEFKGETRRVDQMFASMRRITEEMRETVSKEFERRHQMEVNELKLRHQQEKQSLVFEIKEVQERDANNTVTLAQKDERIQALLKDLASKEAQNLEFHEKFLESAAQQDEARAKKMESFYKELTQKESKLEALWEQRHAELEAEHKARTESLKKRHDELIAEIRSRAAGLEELYSKRERDLELAQEQFRKDREAWDTARLAEAQSLSKRREELALQADTLSSEHRKKQQELQKIKESMQAELAEVVRQYQSKMRGPGA